jgi:hypothetical protein
MGAAYFVKRQFPEAAANLLLSIQGHPGSPNSYRASRSIPRRAGRQGVTFSVELKKGVNGSLLCYVTAPDGISIELVQC